MYPQTWELEVFADYYQFYVCDEAFSTDTGTLWDDVATDRMLAAGADLVAVGTARNCDVPVTLEILGGEPPNDFADWDHVVECGIHLSSGRLILFGCTEDPKEAPRFHVRPGDYCARISYGNLTELFSALEGNDRYRVQLWPGTRSEVSVAKRRPS